MNTTPRRSRVIDTLFVWGATVEEAMAEAQILVRKGWKIHGNPAPMEWDGVHGTGVSISRDLKELFENRNPE